MKLLAFESTAKVASVALMEDGRPIDLYHTAAGRTQSELLLPMAERILSLHSLTPADIDLYAVTVGPGSFTGVRIGVATVKGLAHVHDTPCVGVSTLTALAENLAGVEGVIVAAMDARRSQVYEATFRTVDGEVVRLCEDRAISIDELLTELGDIHEPIYVVGDAYELVHRAAAAAGVPLCTTPPLLRDENASSCAAVAYRAFLRGEAIRAATLSPVYLRLPQAERERLEKLQQNKE